MRAGRAVRKGRVRSLFATAGLMGRHSGGGLGATREADLERPQQGPDRSDGLGMTEQPIPVAQIARMWEEFRLLTRHGPCRNCERMHGALDRLLAVLAASGEDGAASLYSAIRGVRRPAELHPPLGCQPCSTEAALRHGDAARESEASGAAADSGRRDGQSRG